MSTEEVKPEAKQKRCGKLRVCASCGEHATQTIHRLELDFCSKCFEEEVTPITKLSCCDCNANADLEFSYDNTNYPAVLQCYTCHDCEDFESWDTFKCKLCDFLGDKRNVKKMRTLIESFTMDDHGQKIHIRFV